MLLFRKLFQDMAMATKSLKVIIQFNHWPTLVKVIFCSCKIYQKDILSKFLLFFFVKWLRDKRLNNVVRYSSFGCCLLFCFRIIAELCSFEKKRKIWLKMHLIGKLAKISSNQKWNEIFLDSSMFSWPRLIVQLHPSS